MSTLNEFISAVKIGGLAKPSKFEVNIAKPEVVNNLRYKNNSDWRTMLMYCEQATLPGINYTTTQSRTFGEFREMPYERIFDPLQLSFYCDSSMWIKGFFDEWISKIQDSKTREFAYYDKYTVPISVDVLNNEGAKTYGIDLYECYPKTMSAIQLDYGAKDVMKLQISFQYRYWRNKDYAKTQDDQRAAAILQTNTSRVIAPQIAPREVVNNDLRQGLIQQQRLRSLGALGNSGNGNVTVE
jgi:hypothetical protein